MNLWLLFRRTHVFQTFFVFLFFIETFSRAVSFEMYGAKNK